MFFAMLIPSMLSNSVEAYRKYRYESLPISAFYENLGVISSDVCVGDTEQFTFTERYARRTNNGWRAYTVKELFRHNEDGSIDHLSKYNVSREIFVESEKNGISSRSVAMPLLEAGEYHWEINITDLYLPLGVVRDDVPPIITNNFEVKECDI